MKLERKESSIVLKGCKRQTLEELFGFYNVNLKRAKSALEMGKILVNQKKATLETIIETSDEIEIPQETVQNKGKYDSLEVLYEDEVILIVNKPAGIIVHSDGNEGTKTLNEIVEGYFHQKGLNLPARAIHRLDKETSGCVLYSKTSFFQPYLDHLLSEKKIRREYIAVVEGIVPWDKKTCNARLGKDRHHNSRQRVSSTGKEAVTHFTVISRNKNNNTTKIACQLETGRTHQIRVHLAFLHYPILADELYGKKSSLVSRCALHACKISWIDPLTNEDKRVESKLPVELNQL